MDRLIEKLFEKGRIRGFEDQEIYHESAKSLRISVYQGEVEKFNMSEQGGLSYRGITGGKMGYAYTEILDENALDMLVDEAYSNAAVIESQDRVFLHDGSGTYKDLSEDEGMDRFGADAEEDAEGQGTTEDKISFMLELEKKLMESDKRIVRISGNAYSESVYTKHIRNTKGLNLSETRSLAYAYAVAVAQEGEDTRTGTGAHMAESFAGLDMDEIVNSASGEALSMLGAKPVPSSEYPVVFENEAFSDFFSQFSNHFSAEQVQKKLSALSGKLGSCIASDQVNITDDPHIRLGLRTTAFDAEGVATYKKPIIENGILMTYLHNLKTAHIDGTQTTGNASKSSFKSSVEIAPSNLCFMPGKISLKSMLEDIRRGVMVTGLQGLHSGINQVSGDFSLQCHGFLIEDGTIAEPVSQITVSGNFFELLKEIDCVADDFIMSPLSGGAGAPSVRVSGLSISGS